MGRCGRIQDYPPYRAMGPVTAAEYESRQDRYDEQLKRLVEIEPEGMSTKEKMAHLRKYREDQYEQLMDCLLYTSDADDERSRVDLGGRRVIKKKKKTL